MCGSRNNVLFRSRWLVASVTFLVLVLAPSFLRAQERKDVEPIPIAEIKRDKPVSFFEEVLPILEEKCLACHSVSLAEGNLNLEEVPLMLKGGKRGPAIIPGRGADSLLIKVASRQAEPYMPPPEKKDYAPLTPEELGLIKLWIDQGAKDDSEEAPEEAIELRPLPPQLNAILAVELSPDGRFVAVGRGNRVQVYDTETGTLVVDLSGHLDFVQSLAWSPDSRLLASGSYRLVKVWEAPRPVTVGYFADPQKGRGLTAHLGPINSVVSVGEGARVVTAAGDGRLKLWDVDSGELLGSAGSPVGIPTALAPVPGTESVLVAGGNRVALVGTSDWSVRRVWTFERPIRCLAVAQNARLFAAGTDQGAALVYALPRLEPGESIMDEPVRFAGGVDAHPLLAVGTRVFELNADGNASLLFEAPKAPARVALSPDRSYAAWTDDGGHLHLRSLADGTDVVWEAAHPVDDVRWLARDRLVVVTAAPSLELLVVSPQEGKAPVVNSEASRPLPEKSRLAIVGSDTGVYVVLDGGRVMKTTAALGELQEVAALGSPVASVASTEDGQRLAILGKEGQCLTVEVANGKVSQFRADPGATAVTFDASGEYVVTVGSGGWRVYEVAGGAEVFVGQLDVSDVRSLLALDNGRFVALSEKGARLVHLDPGSFVAACNASGAACAAVAFGSGDKELVVGLANGTFTAFDPMSGKTLRSQRSPGGELRDLVISPLGNLLVTAMTDRQAYVWNYGDFAPYPQGGANQRKLGGFNAPLRDAEFLGDGIGVVLAADDGTVRLHEVVSGRLIHQFDGHTTAVLAVAGLAGNRLVTAAADGTMRLWRWSLDWTDRYQITGVFAHRVLSLDFSPDGRFLVTGGGEPSRSGEIKLFDAQDGTLVRDFAEPHTDTVFGLDFSPDGTMLASASADKLAKIFDLTSGQELRKLEGHTHHVLDVVWRWDGQRVVTAGADNVLKVWDVRTGEQTRTIPGHNKQVTSLAAVPRTNEVISAGADAQVRRYNTDNGGTVRTYGGAKDFLFAVSVDGEGRWVAAGGQESILFIWRLDNGQLVHRIGPPPRREVAAR